MIMARNEDGTYSQVGFVKDNNGVDTEYIYDKDGDIVFEKGFTRETSGTVPLTINGIEKDLKAWSITGNTVQNGTPTPENPVEVQAVGDRTENLFDKTQPTTITNKYLLSNGEESSSASGWAVSAYIPVNGEYVTISGVGGNLPSICAYDSNMQFVRGKNYAGTNITTINISECSYIRFSYVPSVQGNTAMLNSGSTALPYEPYGYKIPVVTRGKNLFKAQMYTSKTENGVTWESNGDGTITVSGIASGYSSFMLSNAYPIPSNCIGQNLTFDYRISNVSNIVWDLIVFYDENNTEVGRYASGEKDAVTIKIEPNFKKVTASIKRQDNYKTIGTVGLMIEFGTKATTYEPYHEPITTPIYLPTPLYSGEVMRSDGSRDVKFGKLVLTGEETFTTHKTFEDGTISIRIPSSKVRANGIIYCTHLQNVSFAELYNSEKQGIASHLKNDLDNLYCLISGFTKVTQYKDFFRNEYSAGTPVTVWYQLAEPTTETFTVPKIPTISGTTIIDVNTKVKPTEMYTKYKSSK